MECIWPEWSQWTEWSNNCDVDVGEGMRMRACSVQLPHDSCPGETRETRQCIETGQFYKLEYKIKPKYCVHRSPNIGQFMS